MAIKDSTPRKIFLFSNITLLIFISLLMLLPILHVVAQSFSSSGAIDRGEVSLFPVQFTLDNYLFVFQDMSIWRSFGVTVFITVFGTLFNLIATASLAYPLSRKEFIGRRYLLFMVLFTMIFSAPLIPTYLLIQQLGLLNSLWALILPTSISAFNFFVMRSFFLQIPQELIDASRMDGCSELRILLQIILPLSKPALATLGIFYAVFHWNTYFHALMFISDRKLYPLQVKLREMIADDSLVADPTSDIFTTMLSSSPEGIKMAAIVVATIPILMIYPFLQRYFIKGFMLGSIKD
ncbi:ABC transporter permease [Alkalihalobacillus alcalophilus ATCC 27647 = CGMCC 1.3604]|uniref:ABC transporter permease n=1 Tax=Alkalihalobacillus alcalophilus ATCC 27647 = CGMCC 1.3604 TaxID=1218173 RepID=J8TLW5_ALKAL|nr:carbohydrate ABC transporter permease [Alkalihalobacillus alcalophilus]AFV25717.1 sugar transporter [Alkalihalobacillus alcalophilus ATCC 27647 = CGMCC 1.3604]KGA97826.1 ABC transporter permease [Alkalihalobacillus alcalophilus ATCC 27647 = CGMCC 1.3604]MED1563897.1 carbohydrate ABC transporter permease [Alkalihalobacillus alcalophilus]THG90229.1 ABC transporter permease [Alkalihalobacillus alcalophilus ATCC 27647 = CGMCC 1.3604]